jgi:hypothetical protein
MTETHLNKPPKFFYFRTRIQWQIPNIKKPISFNSLSEAQQKQVWETALTTLDELRSESGVDVYGLVIENHELHIVFSTPYFNENILILDWEMRLKRDLPIMFDRPISCEPISHSENVKRTLIEIYQSQYRIHQNSIQWQNNFNSLKLIFDGNRRAHLFKDPLRVVFQPSLVFQMIKEASKSSAC